MVQGHVELQIFNKNGETYVLDTLKQGDVLGMYSVLFGESFLFTAIAKKNARILTLDVEFFLENQEEIEGLDESITKAEKYIEHYGIPMCDFKRF